MNPKNPPELSKARIPLLLATLLFATGCGKSDSEPISPPEDIAAEESMSVQAVGQPASFPLTDAQKQRLVRIVEAWRFSYDPDAKLLLIPKPKPKFKNNFVSEPMHAIRWSAEYAVACMDSGTEENRQRALDILDVVLKTQDTDPTSEAYGLWPDYLEMPLEEMRSPDGNSADFLGIALIQIRFVHGDRLPEEMKKRIDDAILHCARSTMERDMTPAYTNPAMMSLVLTLVAGQAYGDDELRDYGMYKLRKILVYTKEQGSFTEYNSPNYTTVAVNALQLVKNYVRDPEALAMIDELYHLAWKHVAVRFHPPTGQWSGPHSRSYQELLPEGYQRMIEAGLAGTVSQTNDLSDARAAFEPRLVHHIPDDLKHYFTALDEPREVIERFEKPAYDWMPDVVGTTWLTPKLSLGTINRSDMWNQRRNLQAYWGTAKKPAYLRTRFLKDDDDFASVNFFSVQHQTTVLAALNFSTNGGDTHLFQDAIKGGKFSATSLRLRFEFGGAASKARVDLPATADQPVRVEADGMSFAIQAPVAVFDGQPGHWETGRDGKMAWLDLVLYDGPKKTFSLAEVGDSVIGFGFAMSPDAALPNAAVSARLVEDRLALDWEGLELSIPALPGPREQLQAQVVTGYQGPK